MVPRESTDTQKREKKQRRKMLQYNKAERVGEAEDTRKIKNASRGEEGRKTPVGLCTGKLTSNYSISRSQQTGPSLLPLAGVFQLIKIHLTSVAAEIRSHGFVLHRE